jgi:hypothetical protein
MQLWAIILRNASDVFLAQTESRKFIDVLADVITSPKTSPVVRDRLMEVLAGAVFITGSRTSLSIADIILSYRPFLSIFPRLQKKSLFLHLIIIGFELRPVLL